MEGANISTASRGSAAISYDTIQAGPLVERAGHWSSLECWQVVAVSLAPASALLSFRPAASLSHLGHREVRDGLELGGHGEGHGRGLCESESRSGHTWMLVMIGLLAVARDVDVRHRDSMPPACPADKLPFNAVLCSGAGLVPCHSMWPNRLRVGTWPGHKPTYSCCCPLPLRCQQELSSQSFGPHHLQQ
jgi:hypothetical protein